jgi:hypothetical protein
MTFWQQLKKKLSASDISTKTNCPTRYCVERFKDNEWKKFGDKSYKYKEDAVNAWIDWQFMFAGIPFRVSEDKNYACQECN